MTYFSNLREEVLKNNGFLVGVPVCDLRDAVNAMRLGRLVMADIKVQLHNVGLNSKPDNFYMSSSSSVVIYAVDHPVEVLFRLNSISCGNAEFSELASSLLEKIQFFDACQSTFNKKNEVSLDL